MISSQINLTMLYLGISDLPIYRFDKIQNTMNLSYLVVDYNERNQVEIPKEAEALWDEIESEWQKRTHNNEAMNRYALYDELSHLETRFRILTSLIYGLNEKNKEAFAKEIKAWGFSVNLKDTPKVRLKSLERQLRAAKMRISLKSDELEELSKGGESISLIKQKVKLERVLGFKIDTRQTPVEEWLAIYDEAAELKKASNGK